MVITAGFFQFDTIWLTLRFSLQGFTEQLSNSAAALKDTVKKVEDAAKEHAEKLGHSVSSINLFIVVLRTL